MSIKLGTLAQLCKAAYMENSNATKGILLAELNTDLLHSIAVGPAYADIYLVGDTVVLACRGTEVKSIRDVLADIGFIPRRRDYGWVHFGFWVNATRIRYGRNDEYVGQWKWLYRKIFGQPKKVKMNVCQGAEDWIADNLDGRQLIITGHSLGASMATLLSLAQYKSADYLVTFGSPRAVSGLGGYRLKLRGTKAYRIKANGDGVTQVPPALMLLSPYRHLGVQIKIGVKSLFGDHVMGSYIKDLKTDGLFDTPLTELDVLYSQGEVE